MKKELFHGSPEVKIILDLQGLDDTLPAADIADARPGIPSRSFLSQPDLISPNQAGICQLPPH